MRALALAALLLAGCFIAPDRPGGPGTTPPAGKATLAAGSTFACSIRPDATLRCWGDDTLLQLGGADRPPAPQLVGSGGDAWSTVAAAVDFACGIAGTQLECWGNFQAGPAPPAPVPLPLGVTADKLFGGQGVVCTITMDGDIYCLGDLYDASQAGGARLHFDHWTKLDIGGGGPWDSLALAYAHSCALDQAGHAYCWGDNGQGELGIDPMYMTRTLAEAMPIPGQTFTRLTSGDGGSCGITTAGDLLCWGGGIYGNAGVQAVSTDHSWTDLTGELDFFCGIHQHGTVACFGFNQDGALGNGFAMHATLADTSVRDASQIASGTDFACAANGSGDVSCWGSNQYGQIGNHLTAVSRDPVKLTLPAGTYSNLAVGIDHTCALIDGKPWCWGANFDQQSAPMGPPVVPPTMVLNATYTQLVAAGDHTCAAAGDEMDCWGTPSSIGSTTTSTQPTKTSGTWASIAVGDRTSCAAPTGGGTITCVGELAGTTLAGDRVAVGTSMVVTAAAMTVSYSGLLCSSTPSISSFTGSNNITAIVAAAATTGVGSPAAHVCFIDSTAGLYCFGSNGTNQAGPTGDCLATPTQVPGTWVEVTVMGRHTCALDNNSVLYCWGQNEVGELGTLQDISTTPTQFSNPRPWNDVSLGLHHMCGIATSDGQVYCWGLNIRGEAGSGEHFHEQPTPVQF